MVTRANAEILVTYEALKAALGLDESVTIVGQATEPGDVRTGRIRLLVIAPGARELHECQVAPVLDNITLDDVEAIQK